MSILLEIIEGVVRVVVELGADAFFSNREKTRQDEVAEE